MDIQSIIENVSRLSKDKGYWFVRTDRGLHFNTFVENSFIGIGWNHVTNKDLVNMTEQGVEVKTKITEVEANQDSELTPIRLKSNTTSIFNKLVRFKNLKQGDIVVIPSAGSYKLAFGVIQDTDIYTETKDLRDCDYQKRRRVKWLEIKTLEQLDDIFYQIIKSRHAICDIKKYESHIDNVTETLYVKDDFVHFVLSLNIEEDINLNELLELISGIGNLANNINQELGLGEEVGKLTIKLNLQSPGKIVFKNAGQALMLAAILIASSCGKNAKKNDPKIEKLIEPNQKLLEQIDKRMDTLKGDKERLNRIR